MEKANKELLAILLREWYENECNLGEYEEISIPLLLDKILDRIQ